MKILQIINAFETGGAEKLLLDSIPVYRKLGIEMDVLLLWNNEHPFTKELQELNVCKIFILHESVNKKDVYKLSNIPKIAAIIKSYDIAHVHLFPSQYFVVLANLINRNRTKLIFTEHNTSNKRIKNLLLRSLDKLIYRGYERLVCISKEVENIYKSYLKLPETFYITIWNGIDLRKIKEAKPFSKSDLELNLKESDRLIIQVSGFRPQKDQKTLIRSMKLLPERMKLILVGEGALKSECEQLVRDLNLEKRVLFLGQRMDVPQLLKTADFVVLSTHYEGLSLACVEGMASGRPFLASDVVGVREVVRGAGILFPCGDDYRLAEEILKLKNDTEYFNLTIRNSTLRAEQYDNLVMINKYVELYNSIYESSFGS
ncbi:MAG: glycosyltransferase [Chitinophagaceae bacterium]|nr:glycosyltransferase [Chitinophagaceae bacterium]